MGQLNSCPRCNAAIVETTLDGLCPACAAAAILNLAGATFPDATSLKSMDFGEFELIEEIARGGMGVVYKARQKRLNRLVALKMILAGRFAGDEQVKRFRAEAEAAASLRHPNIVAIHDVGEVAGQHYFCMDLIEGPNLSSLIRDRPLSHLKAALLVQEVAQAVQYAHEHGVVHRDLKPSNIIIDPEGRPHVTDFGLAKFVVPPLGGPGASEPAKAGTTNDLTLTGQVLGSPNYMPPEQADPKRGPITAASDVYSLGAILYYLLVGRPPFQAESLERTLSLVVSSDPIAPHKLDPGVPRDLETICLKCLEKEPARRYATAGLLADELGRCRRGEPIQARPIGAPEKLLRWTRRNRTVARLTALAAMILLLGVTGVLWQWQRADQSARDEHRQRTRAEGTVIELQWQRAEDLLSHGESARGLALLANILRQSPTNRTVAERILSVLTQRRFPLPVTPPLHHHGAVVDAAFNADGTRVATASADGTASIWDAATGQRMAGPITHGLGVTAIRFSPDGTRIVTASKDRHVRCWKSDTGLPDGPFLLHSNSVVALELDPGGEFALTTTRTRHVSLWRLAAGTLAFPSISHTSQVMAARFSPDGKRFLTASFHGLVRVFDVATGRAVQEKDFEGQIVSARFSPDGQRIALANYGQWGAVWIPGGSPELVTVRHKDVVNDAMFSPDGELFATISRDRRALIWDSRTGDLVFALPAHLTWVEEMAFRSDGLALITREESDRVVAWDLLTSGPASEPVQSPSPLSLVRLAPDGKRVLLGAIDGTAQIWNVTPAGAAPVVLPHYRSADAIAFSPDGGRIITGTKERRAVIWDSKEGTAGTACLHQGEINTVEFSRNGSNFLTASADATARVWSLGTTNAPVIVRHRQGIESAAFSPDGRWFVTASFDGSARTWITETGEPLGKPMRAGGRVWHAEFSPDGQRVATAAEDMARQSDHQARIWVARTGEPVTQPLRHGEGVFRVSFDPSGRILATASRDSTAALWNLDAGTRLLEVKHDGPVTFVDFSPDGTRILTASMDNTARIWDARTGRPFGDKMRHAHEVRFAAWSPDGRRVATACEDGSARVWDAATGKPLTDFFWHVGRVASVQFSPDGGRLACAARPTHIWDLPRVSPDPPTWLPGLAEAVIGLRMSDAPHTDAAGPPDLFALRAEVTARSDAEPLVPWAKAFFGQSVPAVPGSKASGDAPTTVTGPSSLNPTVWAAMRELRRNSSNSVAWSQLYDQARREQDQTNPFRHAQAEYFSRKTVTTGPPKLEHWLERLRWLNQTNRYDLRQEATREAARHFPDTPQFQSAR